MNNSKPVIGTIALGLIGYWSQFPGMKEHLTKKHEEFVALIKKHAEVIDVGLIDSSEASHIAGEKFQKNDVDIVFCQPMTYATSDNLVPAIEDLNVPIILFNVQENKKLDYSKVRTLDDWLGHGCTCAGLAEQSAMLRRYNKRYDIVTGYLNDGGMLEKDIEKWALAASIRRRFKNQNGEVKNSAECEHPKSAAYAARPLAA